MSKSTSVMLAALVVAVGLLVGCAAGEKNYRNAQTLMEGNRSEEALAEYRQALQREPNNARYRVAYLNARDKSVNRWIDEAERLRRRGIELGEARTLYLRVLALDENNSRAQVGLAELDRDVRLADMMRRAKEEAQQGKADLALARVRTVLTERPQLPAAIALRDQLLEQLSRPKAGADAKLAEAFRKPVSIEFRDAPLKQVFEVLSRSSGLNFVLDKDVRGDQRTTLFLRNTTIADAVGLAMLTNQLEQRVLDAHTILIYPNTPAKLREYQPLSVKSFFLSSADAKTVANSLKTLLKVKDVVVDEKQNMIMLRDSPDAILMAEKLVALQDQPEAEVMLEVEILEIKRSRLLQAGVQYPSQVSFAPMTLASGVQLTLADLRNITASNTAVSALSVGIQANNTVSDINVLANPRIRSRNREKAKVQVGQRVPNITSTSTSTGFVAESVQYVDVGMKLEVEPTVSPDGEVAIKIGLEVSNILQQIQTKGGSIAYEIGTRNANTVLRLRDGENQVLAGLITDEDRRTIVGVPGLSDIPALGGVLFGNTNADLQKSEIVLSITPRIVRSAFRPDLATSEFESGTESRLRGRGAEVGSASSAPASDPVPVRTEPRTMTPVPSIAPSPSSGPTSSSATPLSTDSATLPNTSPTPAPSPGGVALSVARASWSGPATLRVGEVFSVQLLARSDQALVNLQVAIGFDPKLMELLAVTEGGFMRQGDVATTFNQRVEGPGQVVASVSRPGPAGATAQGTVLTLNFRAMATTDAALVQLITAAGIGSDGQPVIVQLPEPKLIKLAS
jgi:general secretion pathway protein D